MTQEEFFERYQYDPEKDFIGGGGFGQVFRAYDTLKDRYVAIKESVVSHKHKFSLKREVELANEIEYHNNIAPYQNCYRFTIGRTKMDYAIIKHYKHGDLDHLITSTKLSLNDKHQITLGILKGIAHLHSEKIIHRDIKPGNILMEYKNQQWIPKIADYGLSRLVSGDNSVSNSSIGKTILYTAPEIFKGDRIKQNIDIWAAGVILYKLFTGELPFNTALTEDTESGRSEIRQKIIKQDLPQKINTIPQPYRTLIEQCLIKDNHKRPQTADELISIIASAKKTATTNTKGEQTIIDKPKLKKTTKEEGKTIVENKPQFHNFTEQVKGIDLDMVAVKGGSFMMGSNEENDEHPIHQVNLDSFYIAKYPVTQELWQAIMGNNPSYFKQGIKLKDGGIFKSAVYLKEDTSKYPVENVSWNDAKEFLKKLSKLTGKNYRLPTEAEWEYAARGGQKSKGYKYAGSNIIDEVAWYYKNSNFRTYKVGTKKPNELDVYDMSGNVWEWCNDWYDINYYNNSPIKNPKGPNTGTFRVYRGGGWNYDTNYCRVAYRYGYNPPSTYGHLGFRPVFLP